MTDFRGFDEKWLADYCARTGQKVPEAAGQPPKRGKYGNQKTTVDGRTYDSKREAKHAGELKLLQKAGKIVGFAEQVTFLLPGGVRYIADFVVLNRDGTYTVQDSKGVRTKEYIIKRKLMAHEHGINIQEV